MSKPVVLIAEELSPATVEALGPDFEIRRANGADRGELLEAIKDVDAILVRSATKVDAEAISAATRLKVVARAGVGLDNVDVKEATKAGVMVVNAPTSNITSAAELAVAHILSLSRHLPQADASLKAGEWKRSKLSGVELYEKKVGIVGLGRIGALVAERLTGFGTELLAYDPYVTSARAAQLGVQLLPLDELLKQADYITVHLPKTPETIGLISDEQFATMKPTTRVINAARGGIIDEDALYRALKDGKIAGAAIDVFEHEPPTGSPLLTLDNVVVTPHLGASTEEAQEKAGVAVAKSVRLALSGELVPDAVNVAGGAIDEDVKPGIPLIEKLGAVFSAVAESSPTQIDVEVHGEISDKNVDALKLAALKGVFQKIVSEQVSYVNAPLLADQRGVAVRLLTDSQSDHYRNELTVRGALSDGRQIAVSGTLTGPKQIEKLTEINGYKLEIPLSNHLLFFVYEDRPGVVAQYGSILGDAGINIGGLQISRNTIQGKALSVISADSSIPQEVIAKISEAVNADTIGAVDLED